MTNWLDRRWLAALLAVLMALPVRAQFPILADDTTAIGFLWGDTLLDAEARPVFTVQGNQVFRGRSTDRSDLQYLVEVGDASTIATTPDGETVFRWTGEDVFTGEDRVPVLHLSRDSLYLAVHDAAGDSLLAYTRHPEISAALSMALVHVILRRFEVTASPAAAYDAAEDRPRSARPGDPIGMIQPLWQTGGYAWAWDGTVLYPVDPAVDHPTRWWAFDGETLRPVMRPMPDEIWVWNGSTLAPDFGFGMSRTLEWEWRGDLLRNAWDFSPGNEFILEGDRISRRFSQQTWELTGELPRAVIAAVVLGYVYR